MPELPVIIDASRAKQGAREAERAMKQVETSATRADSAQGKLSDTMNRSKGSFDRATQAARQTRDEYGRFIKGANASQSAASRLGATLRRLVAAYAGMRIITSIIRLNKEFEQTMLTVQAVTRATPEQFVRMTDTAREMGATTRYSANQAAEAILFLARAGFSADDAIQALPATLALATAGVLDLGTAADIVSNVLSQFGLSAGETERAADALVIVSNRANTDVRQLAEAMKYVGPVAGALGQSMEETAAAVGVLGNAGIQASLAGTNLRGIMAGLLEPTENAKQALDRMNLSLEDLSPITNTITEIFRRLEAAGFGAQEAVELFGRRNAAAALVLAQNIPVMEKLTNATKENEGETRRVANAMEQGLNGALLSLGSAVAELGLAIGDLLRGPFQLLLEFITNTIRALVGMEDQIKTGATAYIIFADILRVVVNVLLTLVAIKIALFFKALIAGAFASTTAFVGLWNVLKAHPLVAIVTAFVAVATAISRVISRTKELTATQRRLMETLQEVERTRVETFKDVQEFNRSLAQGDSASAARLLRTQIGRLQALRRDVLAKADKFDDTGGVVFSRILSTFRQGSFGRSAENQQNVVRDLLNNNSTQRFVKGEGSVTTFDREAITKGLELEIERLNQLATALTSAEERRKAEANAAIDQAEARIEAQAAVLETINGLQFERSLIGLTNFEKKVAVGLRQQENALIRAGVENRAPLLAQLEEELRLTEQQNALQNQYDQLNELAEGIALETKLLGLKGTQLEIEKELARARQIANQTGVDLTKDQIAALENLVRAREQARDQAKAQEDAEREAARLRKEEEKEQQRKVVQEQASLSSTPAVELSSRFSGIAAAFRSNQRPLAAIETNTRRTAAAVEALNRRDQTRQLTNGDTDEGVVEIPQR